MFCKKCGAQIEDNSVFCKECGERLEEQQKKLMPKKKKRIIIISAAAAVLVIAGIIFGVLYTNYVKEQEKEVFLEVSLYEQDGDNYFLLTAESFAKKFNYFSDGIKLGEAEPYLDEDGTFIQTWKFDKNTVNLIYDNDSLMAKGIMIMCRDNEFYQNNLPSALRAFYPSIPKDEIKKCLDKANQVKTDENDTYYYKDIAVVIGRENGSTAISFHTKRAE